MLQIVGGGRGGAGGGGVKIVIPMSEALRAAYKNSFQPEFCLSFGVCMATG
jgi:NADH:ubiquinone oxidoreductase subunit B-like Fe-S oxidoreductase